MKRTIEQIHEQWLSVKNAAALQCLSDGDVRTARLLSECAMFTGTESLEELVALMFTPQGIEFMTRYRFPNLAVFRKFKRCKLDRYGVYIDAGDITISDAKKIFLAGNTKAKIKCSDTALYRLHMMHGATAELIAEGCAVVKVEKDQESTCRMITNDHAMILQ